MFRKLMVAAAALAVFAAVLIAQEGSKTKQKAPPPPAAKAKPQEAGDDGADKFAQSYAAAFNKNDAEALASHWTEKGVYVDRETGERTEGRAAILADFQKLFKDRAGARISITLATTRLVKPDVAAVDGSATATLPGEAPSSTDFSAILVKQEGKWLLESIQESTPAAPASAQDALSELEWLVGHWVDESETTRVDTNVRWGAGNSFLVRSFVVQTADEEEQQGTQVIGWDPQLQQIRSWSFFSDGSFGEGLWSRSGEEWLVKGTHTLTDGRLASGTHVIQRDGDDVMHVQLIGREIDGEPLPSSEIVKVVRAAAPAEAEVGKSSTADEGTDQAKAKTDAPPAKEKKEVAK
jgi:uncharacterized protein (TIGR02246 family)